LGAVHVEEVAAAVVEGVAVAVVADLVGGCVGDESGHGDGAAEVADGDVGVGVVAGAAGNGGRVIEAEWGCPGYLDDGGDSVVEGDED